VQIFIQKENKKSCTVKDALAKEFPHVKNVFIPDATGRQKRDNEKAKMKKMNLVEPSILVPLFPSEESMLLPGLEAKMDQCLVYARKLANGRLLTLHVFHVSNM